MAESLERLGLRHNPFEPSGSGAPLEDEALWLPASWKVKLDEFLDQLSSGQGSKPLAVVGEYGSGKSYLLHWLDRKEFPKRRVRSFYFENPGVQFYDLANSFLRRVGRKQFSKLVWELVRDHVRPNQMTLFHGRYEDYLIGRHRGQELEKVKAEIQAAAIAAKITDDEEIAHCIARIVAETPSKPYFEYRDFLGGTSKSLVAEGEGAPYFKALLRTCPLGQPHLLAATLPAAQCGHEY